MSFQNGTSCYYLVGSGSLAGANGPDGLVGHHHVLPVLDLLGVGAHLAGHHLVGLAGFSLLQGLANAGNDLESLVQGVLGLLGDQLIGLLEDGATLRVTQDDPISSDVLQHGGRDLAGEGTLLHLVGVLAGQTHLAGQQIAGVHQVDGGAADDHLGVGVQGSGAQGLADVGDGLLVAVHLPVASHTEFAAAHVALVAVGTEIGVKLPDKGEEVDELVGCQVK